MSTATYSQYFFLIDEILRKNEYISPILPVSNSRKLIDKKMLIVSDSHNKASLQRHVSPNKQFMAEQSEAFVLRKTGEDRM